MKLFIEDVKDIQLSVDLIGYPEKGESVVFVLNENSTGKVLFSGVIDCFDTETCTKTTELLQANGINSLDFFCWTHTDEDHSIGIVPLVENHCTEKTIFILPEGVNGHEDDFVRYNDEVLKAFELINSSNKGRKYQVFSASANPYTFNNIKRWSYQDKFGKEVKCEIVSLAPSSPLLRRRREGEVFNKNELSIALKISIGELIFFMSGDVENQTLQLIDPNSLQNITYLKTPHHTSKSSDKIVPMIIKINDDDFKIPTVCSTVFKQHDLPDRELIMLYKKCTENFYYTGLDEQASNFGVIRSTYNVVAKSYEVSLQGNATKIF